MWGRPRPRLPLPRAGGAALGWAGALCPAHVVLPHFPLASGRSSQGGPARSLSPPSRALVCRV